MKMTGKEKINTLLEMGFTLDESIALASGNYRTVPDEGKPADPEKKPADPAEKTSDPADKGSAANTFDYDKMAASVAKSVAEAIIKSNIIGKEQPAVQTTDDILSLMLEPNAPEKGGNYGSK